VKSASALTSEIDDHLSGLHEEVKSVFHRHLVQPNRTNDLQLSHFTKQESLIKILHSYEKHRPPDWLLKKHYLSLWLSDVSCLNDPLEGKALFDFVEYWSRVGGFKQFGSKSFSSSEWEDLRHIAGWLRGDAARVMSSSRDPVVRRILICSFTQDTDRIDLWRAYGADGSGICLSMPAAEAISRLQAYKDRVSALYHVRYSAEDKATTWTMLNNHLKPLLELSQQIVLEDDKESLRTKVVAECEQVFHLYKHQQYRNEHEMRLLRTFDLTEPSCFANPRDGFGPGLRVDLELNRVYAYSNPFFFGDTDSQIILGPKVHDASRLATTLSTFLEQLWPSHAPGVGLSTAPYR